MVKQRLTSVSYAGRTKVADEPKLDENNKNFVIQWYRQYRDYCRQVNHEWLIDFCKKEMEGKLLSDLERIDIWTIPYDLGIYARQHVIEHNKNHRNMIVASINALVFNYRKNKEKQKEESKSFSVPNASPVSKARENASKYISDIEDIIDSFVKNNYKEIEEIDFYSLFQGWEIKGIHAKEIIEYYNPLATEIHSALLGKDIQLKEAYQEKIGVAATKRYANFLTKLVVAASNIMRSAQASRKQRNQNSKVYTTKTKKTSDYSDVKYMKNSVEYQLKSIDPSLVKGSSMFLTFNEVYRTLTIYYSQENSVLDIKGTSVINYDEDKSFCVILRKPKEVLPRLFNGNIKYIENSINALTVKKQAARSTLNNNTVLLRTLKG